MHNLFKQHCKNAKEAAKADAKNSLSLLPVFCWVSDLGRQLINPALNRFL